MKYKINKDAIKKRSEPREHFGTNHAVFPILNPL